MNLIMEWAFDHIAAEALFRSPHVLLVGDAEVLAAAVGRGLPALAGGMGWIDIDDGRALMLKGPSEDREGPYVWVLTSDDGPVTSIDISPGLIDAGSGADVTAGWIDVPSGRLVVGTPTGIAWRGGAVEPSGSRQFELFYDAFVPGGLGDYLVVVRLPEPGRCEVVVVPGALDDQISHVSVDFPVPTWLPTPRPLILPGTWGPQHLQGPAASD